MFNKKCTITLGLFCLTLFLGFASMHVMLLFEVSKYVGIIIASCIFAIMLTLLIIFHKLKFISYLVIPVNVLANGIAASSLFVHLEIFPEIWHTALLFIALCLLFFLYCILTRVTFFQEHFVICIGTFLILITACAVTCLILTHYMIFALALLCLIPLTAYLLLLTSKAKNGSEQIKFGAYSSFAVLALIILAVLIVISQGEGLDGLGDGIDGFGGDTKNKNNPYEFKPLQKRNKK